MRRAGVWWVAGAAMLSGCAAALAEAAAGGAQIACFPEACLFGWVNPEAHELADPIPGRSTARLGELAREHGAPGATPKAGTSAAGGRERGGRPTGTGDSCENVASSLRRRRLTG